MNKLLSLTFVLLLTSTSIDALWAQKINQKWGKPSEEEWAYTQWEESPEVDAVVLYKSMTATYKLSRSFNSYSGTSEILSSSNLAFIGTTDLDYSGTTVMYDCRLRTKILKDSGTGYANIDIIYYSYEKEELKATDTFESLKVAYFRKNEKGKAVKTQVNSKDFADERVNDYYRVIHVTVPEAQAGDIIEYHYQITSNRITFLYDWSFQENIPVLYSKCDLDIPAMLTFNMNVPIHECIKSSVNKGVVRMESNSGDMQAPKSYPTNHYIIEGRNVAPKNLDPQRMSSEVDAAKVKAMKGKVNNIVATINNANLAKRPAPMPSDKSHLTIKP